VLLYLSLIDSEEDKSKFERLYLAYKQQMYYAANRILKDSHLAEDAVHQAFLRIIDNLEKINENECHKTKGFVVIIVEHVAIDFYNRRKKENAVSWEENEYVLEDMEKKDFTKGGIEALLLELPVNYSSVLRLKYAHGYENQEIAKILRITEENVRQRILRGRKFLEKLMSEGGIREV